LTVFTTRGGKIDKRVDPWQYTFDPCVRASHPRDLARRLRAVNE
jgi:hypothetical protein